MRRTTWRIAEGDIRPRPTAELGVEIRLDLPDEKIEVLGERDELVEVFENLIENACKYGQDGEVVEVALRRDAGGATEVSACCRNGSTSTFSKRP